MGMAAPLDSFIEQLQHRTWTQFIPLAFLGVVAGAAYRFGTEKLVTTLARLFRSRPEATPPPESVCAVSDDAIFDSAPCCPFCRRPMVQRPARQGTKFGASFWGCVGFPSCRGTRQISREDGTRRGRAWTA